MSGLRLGRLDPLQLEQPDLDESIPHELTDYTKQDMDKVCPSPPLRPPSCGKPSVHWNSNFT